MLAHRPHDPSIGQFELNNFLTLQALIARLHIDCEFVVQPGVRGIYDNETLLLLQASLTSLQISSPELASRMHLVTSKEELQRYRLAGAVAALYTDVAARLWPYKLVAKLLEDLLQEPEIQSRFNLQTLTPVHEIEQLAGSTWLVRTERGAIEADHVFLATNAYTSHLLPSFADLIVPCRGQMSALLPPAWLSGENRLRTSLGFEGAVMDRYLIQRPSDKGEHLMLGGGRQLNPTLGVSDDSVIDPEVAKYLRSALPQTISHSQTHQELELKAEREWTGIMAWSRDCLPWVGTVPDLPGLYMSAGYTGHGMPNAWLCGKTVVLAMLDIEHGACVETAMTTANLTTGLPKAYVLDQARIDSALESDFEKDPHTLIAERRTRS